MRSIMTVLSVLTLILAALLGCREESSKPATVLPVSQPAVVKPEEPKPVALPVIDRSTPENTLNSYWAIQDAMLSVRGNLCEDCVHLREHQKGVATGDMLEGYQFPFETHIVYAREIKETKKKPGKDAVDIVAVIKNVTPFPPEASPDNYVKKKRENGDKYRYSLINTEEGWKITEIFLWYEPTRQWLKITSPKPLVPFQTIS